MDAEGKPIAHPRIGVELGADDKPLWHHGDRSRSVHGDLSDAQAQVLLPPGSRRWVRTHASVLAVREAGDPLPAEFTFEMTKAVTVGGVVVDESGKPIAGANRFILWRRPRLRSGASGGSLPSIEEEFTTDERGRWKCDLAPANISDASINVRHPDYAIDTGNYQSRRANSRAA